MTIHVIDYGMGNLASVLNILKKVGQDAVLAARPEDLSEASRLVLPGVGAFDAGVRNLHDRGLWEVVDRKVRQGTPILGICLGAQLFAEASEEGSLPGFGWFAAKVVRFRTAEHPTLRVPHMGWNELDVVGDHPFLRSTAHPRFYFVHSYHFECAEERDVAATTVHGYRFAAAILKRNMFGVQFHPEKSHKFGMRLLEEFARWEC